MLVNLARFEEVQMGTWGERMKAMRQHTPHFFRRLHFNMQPRSRHGMVPFEARAGEVDAMSCVDRARPINQIPDNRMPQCSGMPTDLVGTTGFQTPLHKAGRAVNSPRPVSEANKRRARRFAIESEPGLTASRL